MKMKFLNKKGISPLIATVLLIGFTVALAAVVITWGSGFVNRVTSGTDTNTAKSVACTSDLNFQISKVNCANSVTNPNTVLVNNKGELQLESLTFRFFDVNGDPKGTIVGAGSVGKYELKTVAVPAPGVPIGSTKVEAIATIKLNGQDVVCTDASRDRTFNAC